MLDFIEPNISGYKVVYSYQMSNFITSDFRFIRSLSNSDTINLTNLKFLIGESQKNSVRYINKNLIVYTLPHKQAPLRYHVNLIEIHTMSLNYNCLKLSFYSGNCLEIKVQKDSIYKRIRRLLKIVQHG